VIEIHSNWLDENGFPLPAGLKDRGYTGRLVKVSIDPATTNDPYDTQITEFPINPGKALQVLKFGEGEVGKYHYYLQVNGKTGAESNDFSTGNHVGVLRHRPNKYVPVKVPLFDETITNVNKILQLQNNPDAKGTNAAFDWVYRPELSFSVVDLEVSSLIRELSDSTRIALNESKDPTVFLQDSALEVLFKLAQSEYDRITPLDGEQTFILAFGEEEVALTIDKTDPNQQIRFENLEHLSDLNAEDYLSIRLYLNEDSQNILWDYAFKTFSLRPSQLKDTSDPFIYVSADDAYVYDETILAMVQGDEEGGGPYQARWNVTGKGSATPNYSVSDTGSFSTSLDLPIKSGEVVSVNAELVGSEGSVKSAQYKIIPGKPRYISGFKKSGTTSISGAGGIDVEMDLQDQFFNDVADGTPVSVLSDDLDVKGELSSSSGKISFTLVGVNKAGSKTVTVKSGEAETTFTVNVGDIDLSITPFTDPTTHQTVTLEITATGDSEGMTVSLGAHRGKLSDNQVVIHNGRAQATLYTGEFAGSANVFARFGEKITRQDFEVVDSDLGNILLDSVLVKDSASGSVQAGGVEYQYTNSTQYRIKGTPGEVIPVSLQDAIEPQVSYEFNSSNSQAALSDLYGDFDAQSDGAVINRISHPTNNYGAILAGGAKISTPFNENLIHADDVAFKIAGNFQTPGTLVNYQASSMQLSMAQDQSFTLAVETSNGELSITSAPVDINQWLEITASVTGGELSLSVNGETVSSALTGTLLPVRSGQAVVIGGNAAQNLKIVSFELVDLSGVQLLGLEGGALNGDFTVQEDGYARVNVQVPAATIVHYQNKQQQAMEEMLTNTNSYSLFKQAYAADGDNTDCAVQTVQDDYILSQAEAMLETLLNCVIGKRIEVVTLRYETADGFRDKSIALAERALLETVYSHINWGGKGLIVAADCLQGALTGDPQSGVGATCDFISSLLLIGDIRDLIFQGFYWFVDDQGNFSPMTATFATLGIAGSTLAALSAGSGSGVAFAAAAAKQIPKAFKGAKFLPHFADFINKKVLVDDWAAGAKQMDRALPFIELTAFVGFTAYSPEMKVIRDFISEAISDPEDMYTWIDYLADMAKKASSGGLLTNNQNGPQQELQRALYAVTSVLISQAHAANVWDDLQSASVKRFIKIIEEVKDINIVNGEGTKVAAVFTDALTQLNKAALNGTTHISDLKFEPKALKSLVAIYQVGGIDTLKRLRSHQGFSTLNDKPTMLEFLEMIGDLDYSKLSTDQLKGLRKIFNGFDAAEGVTGRFTTSQGATHEFFDISKHFDNLAGIQFRKIIKIEGSKIELTRIYDYVLKDGWHVDKKAWKPETINKWFKASAKGDILPDGSAKTGQLFRDIIAAEGGTKIRWSFDARAGAIGKEKLLDMAEDSIKENFDAIAGVLKFDVGSFKNEATAIEALTDRIMKNFDIEIGDI
jgi:hypothetical protein